MYRTPEPHYTLEPHAQTRGAGGRVTPFGTIIVAYVRRHDFCNVLYDVMLQGIRYRINTDYGVRTAVRVQGWGETTPREQVSTPYKRIKSRPSTLLRPP
jgi:hypothetical protein